MVYVTGFLFDRKALTDPKRLVAVLVMIVMIVMTIVSATVLNNGILALIFCILQFLSYLWYCLRTDFKLMPVISDCDHFGFFYWSPSISNLFKVTFHTVAKQ